MHTNPVQSTPAQHNEATAKTVSRQSHAAQSSSVPQDNVTLSPQAQAQIQVQAQSQQALAAGKDQNGDSR